MASGGEDVYMSILEVYETKPPFAVDMTQYGEKPLHIIFPYVCKWKKGFLQRHLSGWANFLGGGVKRVKVLFSGWVLAL